jgi:hypothetical protein
MRRQWMHGTLLPKEKFGPGLATVTAVVPVFGPFWDAPMRMSV